MGLFVLTTSPRAARATAATGDGRAVPPDGEAELAVDGADERRGALHRPVQRLHRRGASQTRDFHAARGDDVEHPWGGERWRGVARGHPDELGLREGSGGGGTHPCATTARVVRVDETV